MKIAQLLKEAKTFSEPKKCQITHQTTFERPTTVHVLKLVV